MAMKKQPKNIRLSDYRHKMCQISAEKAIQKLLKSNAKVNFSSVSKVAKVSRAFLYNNKEIRSKIEAYREEQYMGAQVKYGVSNRSKDVIITQLNTKVESLEKKINQKENKIKALEKELNHYKLMIFED